METVRYLVTHRSDGNVDDATKLERAKKIRDFVETWKGVAVVELKEPRGRKEGRRDAAKKS